MRFASILVFSVSSMLVSANSARLDNCSRTYCLTETVALTNFTVQSASVWEDRPPLGVALNRFAEDAVVWFARFLPAVERPTVASAPEAPKAAKKAPTLFGDSSLASYVRGLRGLHSYEYVPTEVKPLTTEELVISPQ